MAAVTSTTTAVLSDVIRQELAAGVRDTLPRVDPVFEDIMSSSVGVMRNDIGRDWQVRHNFKTSVAGGYKWIAAAGGATQGGEDSELLNQSLMFGTQQAYPTVSEAPAVGYVQRILTLGKALGNFYVPEDMLKLDALAATVTKLVADNVSGVAKRVAQQHAIAFYQAGNEALHAISSISTYTGTAALTYTPSGGRIRHMQNGMVVDVYSSDYVTQRNSSDGPYIVDGVDYVGNTVRLVRADGTAISDGIVNTDVVVLRSSYSATKIGPYGLADWIKSSGTLFHSGSQISLTTYPQFKSRVTAVSAALTDIRLNHEIGSFMDAYDVMLDSIITTRGVLQKYIEQPTLSNGNLTWDRQGKALNYVGGWAKASYQYDGRTYQWMISPYCPSQTMYIVKLGEGNLVMYVPPPLTAAGSDSAFPQNIEFTAPLGGHSGIFKLAHTSSGATQPMLEAPFQCRSQFAPKDVQSIKLTGLTESTGATGS